jgi:cell division protein FtsB
MNYWGIVYRFACALVAILLIVAAACIFLPRCNRLREFQRQKEGMEAENRGLEQLTHGTRDKRDLFASDPRFVERTAREMGMVRTNETVIKLVPRTVAPTGARR